MKLIQNSLFDERQVHKLDYALEITEKQVLCHNIGKLLVYRRHYGEEDFTPALHVTLSGGPPAPDKDITDTMIQTLAAHPEVITTGHLGPNTIAKGEISGYGSSRLRITTRNNSGETIPSELLIAFSGGDPLQNETVAATVREILFLTMGTIIENDAGYSDPIIRRARLDAEELCP